MRIAPYATAIVIGFATMASAGAEGDRANDPSVFNADRPTETRADKTTRRGTATTVEQSRRQARSKKPPPQHRRDFGYSGFVGKSF